MGGARRIAFAGVAPTGGGGQGGASVAGVVDGRAFRAARARLGFGGLTDAEVHALLRRFDATAALRITASDLVALGVVDQVIAEPIGGAHANPDHAAQLLRAALEDALEGVEKGPGATRVEQRHSRFRLMGLAGPPTAGDAPFGFLPEER